MENGKPQTVLEKRRAKYDLAERTMVKSADDDSGSFFSELFERMKDDASDPEAQERYRAEQVRRRHDKDHKRFREYERSLHRLSRLHVSLVREHTDGACMPTDPVPRIWQQLIDRWNWRDSVFLVGPTSTQKTTVATWAAMWCALDGESVTHTTALRVATASEDDLKAWRKTDLLILDEVHRLSEQPAWKIAPVWDLIDFRYQDMSTTIGCGTVDPDAMLDIAGSEVLRRFGLKLGVKK